MNIRLHISKLLNLVTLLVLFIHSTHGQTFTCDGSLLFMVNRDTINNTINKVNFGPFGLITFGPIAYFPKGQYNALGFNALDNYIYGIKEGTNTIVRLKADGSYDIVGEIPDSQDVPIIAGDCTPDGSYMVYVESKNQLYIYDVVDQFALRNKIDLSWESGSPFSTRIHDLAIDPTNPQVAYAVQGNYNSPATEPEASRGFLLQMDIANNPSKVTPVGKISDPTIQKMGSLIFTSDGQLYGYGSDTQDSDYPQKSFMSIDKWSGNVNVSIFQGPTAGATDGCSCPYQLSFYNNVQPREVTCSNTMLTFKFQIINRFFLPLDQLTLRDTIPESMVIEAILGEFDGNITAESGAGSRIIEITDINVPARSSVEIDVQVRLIDGPAGVMKVQASLSNLPARLGGTMFSDDPFSPGAIDDTDFMVFPESLSAYDLEVTHPTECLQSNDASIRLSSPHISPGQSYEVKLLNQEWTVDTVVVAADNLNALLIENMEAGEYELFELTSQSILCPQELQDTVIEIIAPHDKLVTIVSSNAPLCEQLDLMLQVDAPPESTFTWRGPERFGSEDNAPIVQEVNANHSGLYTLATTYGHCERMDTLAIEIRPNVDSKIVGDTLYCERDKIELLGHGEGEALFYRWEKPSGNYIDSKKIFIESASPDNGGLYSLYVDNGACADTSRILLVVAPAPTLTFPLQVDTDNCEPLYLQPILDSDVPVSYAWNTHNLSCLDCEQPEVYLPLESQYGLKVTNTFGCQDSASVHVVLSRENSIYLPNVISRQSRDNQNFQIFPGCAVTQLNKIHIYDRWGSIVYSNGPLTNLETPIIWDGLVDMRRINSGVYTYYVEVVLADNIIERYGGTLTVLD